MSNPTKLNGIENLGLAYDVTSRESKYANAESILSAKNPLFDFSGAQNLDSWQPTDGNYSTKEIWGNSYAYPSYLHVDLIEESDYTSQQTATLSDYERSIDADTSVSGFVDVFAGSVSAYYGEDYAESESYYKVIQKGQVRAYRASLPSNDALRASYMNEKSKEDINNNSLSPETIVDAYGSHFLKNGIFGGTINYAQSVQKFMQAQQTDAEAGVYGNFDLFLKTQSSASYQTTTFNGAEYSDAYCETRGGRIDYAAESWADWAGSVEQGEFVLIDFQQGGSDNASLVPISVLADDPQRQQDLNTYINSLLTSSTANKYQLAWNPATKTEKWGTDEGGLEKELVLTSTDEIIVGVAVSTTNNIQELACRVLNLKTNELQWQVSPGSSDFNASIYQLILDIPTQTGNRGVAMTGLQLYDHSKQVVAGNAIYQILSPVMSSINMEETLRVDKQETKGNHLNDLDKQASYEPDPSAGLAVIGIGLGASGSDIDRMKLTVAKLVRDKVQ